MKYIGNRIGHSVERARAGTDDTGVFNIAQQHKLSHQNEWNNNFSPFNTPAPTNRHKTNTIPAINQRYQLFISGTNIFYIGGTEGLYINYTVIAGGGGGGNAPRESYPEGGGGGGGGGGFVDGQVWLPPGTYTARVGNGGSGAPSTKGAVASNGVPSYISGPVGFTTITATGGGAGASWYGDPENTTLGRSASPGGSGGGACGSPSEFSNNGLGNSPSTSPPQGFNGGARPSFTGPYTRGGAGGGGAGSVGYPSYNGTQYYGEDMAGGRGGDGRAYGVVKEDIHANFPVRVGVHHEPSPTLFISGSEKRFCGGGGGGGGDRLITYPNKGIAVDGGGDGGSSYTPDGDPTNGTPGTANTGGGGGGAGTYSAPPNPSNIMNTGGQGGSGVIIISYTYQ